MTDEYIEKALEKAEFEPLDGKIYGEIEGFQGVWASAPNEEDCKKELREVLTEWCELQKSDGQELPQL